MKKKDKLTLWMESLKTSGKSDKEINKILNGIAKHSGISIYQAISHSLTPGDRKLLDKIKDDNKASEKIEELIKQRTGMSIEELSEKVQLLVFENSVYKE